MMGESDDVSTGLSKDCCSTALLRLGGSSEADNM